jgi:hypothetical protein
MRVGKQPQADRDDLFNLKVTCASKHRPDYQLSELFDGALRCPLGFPESVGELMRYRLVAALSKRLRTMHDEVGTTAQQLPDDMNRALARLKRLRWRRSWHHGPGVHKVRR